MLDNRLWLPYAQMQTAPEPLLAARTEGVHIILGDGRVLIDGIASWWTACHGYNHPHILGGISAQLNRMPHVMLGGLTHEPARQLAARLAEWLPGTLQHSFFSESGSVAVEVAMKMAVQSWLNRGTPARNRFVAFRHAYHGDTFAAMSVCDPEDGMHSRFAGMLLPQHIVELPSDAAALAAFDRWLGREHRQLAGLIIEPLVQAAGGFHMHQAELLARVVAIARRHGLLVIFDEIATGFGRTGSLFACEQADVVPDIITLSKSLTGGTLPLAVTTASAAVFDSFLDAEFTHALMHGPTYCGHPLGCAAALASMDLFEQEPRLAQVRAIEAQLRSELEPCRQLSAVRDVRVKGAIGVVELAAPADLDQLRQAFVGHGTWIRPFGRVVYLMPALTISEDDLSTLTGAIAAVLRTV